MPPPGVWQRPRVKLREVEVGDIDSFERDAVVAGPSAVDSNARAAAADYAHVSRIARGAGR